MCLVGGLLAFGSTDLFQRTRGPHQLIDHVDGDPHEGRQADDVPDCDAPVRVFIIKQGEGRSFQQGAHYDVLRKSRKT